MAIKYRLFKAALIVAAAAVVLGLALWAGSATTPCASCTVQADSGGHIGAAWLPAIDTFGTPTDITTNNATTSAHGLMPKGTGSTTTFYRSDLTQAAPTAAGVGAIPATDLDGVSTHVLSGAGASIAVTKTIPCFQQVYSQYNDWYDGSHYHFRTWWLRNGNPLGFTFLVPQDFHTLVAVTLVGFPYQNNGAITGRDIDVYVDYAAAGSSFHANEASDTTSTYNTGSAANIVFTMSLSTTPFASIAANQMVSVELIDNATASDSYGLYFTGCSFEYE